MQKIQQNLAKHLRLELIFLCIQSTNLTEINTVYSNLTSDNRVKIIVPLNQNIFSGTYGIVEDQFGVRIQLIYDKRLK